MSSPSTPHPTVRQGIALPIALAAIIAVGALIAGVFFASTQEYRVGRNTLGAQRALHGAEVGLSSVVSAWKPSWTASIQVGSTRTLTDTVIDEALVLRQITRVSPTLFWVTSTAVAGSLSLQGRSLKRLNTLIRVDIPDLRIQGAITVRGNVNFAGGADISGSDSTPADWSDCPPAGAPGAGAVVGDSATNVTSTGTCSGLTCVTGTPKIADSSIYADTTTYTQFGDFNYDSLTKLATPSKTWTAGGTADQIYPRTDLLGTTCDESHVRNWGDTLHTGLRPCEDYYPVVWLKGPTLSWTLANRGGQGILLIDGNATFNGNFKWKGLVIVRGTATTEGAGGTPRIMGALIAMNRNNGTNKFAGAAFVRYSRCTLQTVLSRHASIEPVQYRPWADLSF
jgi:hypothetical protein